MYDLYNILVIVIFVCKWRLNFNAGKLILDQLPHSNITLDQFPHFGIFLNRISIFWQANCLSQGSVGGQMMCET